MIRFLLAALGACLIAGCATSTAQSAPSARTAAAKAQPASDDGADAVECDEESSTGSHLVSQACRSQARKKEDRQRSEDLVHRAQQQPASGAPGTR